MMKKKNTGLNFLLNLRTSSFRSIRMNKVSSVLSYLKRNLSVHLHPGDLCQHEEEPCLVDGYAFQQDMAGECETTPRVAFTTFG